MLIDSPRLTDADRAHWARLEAFDHLLAADPRLDCIVRDALDAIHAWVESGPGVISTSWGKDSVAAAHLALCVKPDLPLIWVRSDPYEMPECEDVRDAFLSSHPSTRYEERVVHLRNPKRGEPGYVAHQLNPDKHSQDVLGEAITERYLSGVRAEESRIRGKSLAHRGLTTKNTCRPLGWWTAVDVFAFLAREYLPVHPAYAATYGGVLDRRWIRVHPLCSAPPPRSAVHGRDTSSWEDDYWGDHIAAARRTRMKEKRC